MKLQRYRLELEYDGSEFAGWQVQPGKRTVQGELEKAIAQFFQEEVRVTAAGRTDAGVHALGQVVHFDAATPRPLEKIFLGLNSLLPPDIAVVSVEPVPESFDARYSAVRRKYRYQIVQRPSAVWRKYAWVLPQSLNVHDMQRCSERIRGEHDFRAFCSTQAEVKHYRCTVQRAVWLYEPDGKLVFSVAANRFLHNMVRILVGTMVEVGRGRFGIGDFEQMLESRDRTAAGMTAPPQGLFLAGVDYTKIG